MIGTTLLNLVTIVLGGAGASKKLKGVSKLDDLENVDDLSKLGNLDNVDDLGKLKNIDNMEGSALVDDVGKGGKGRSEAGFRDMMSPEEIARYDSYWNNVADDMLKSNIDGYQQSVLNGLIAKTTGGKINSKVLTAAIDTNTGDIYYGISGMNNNPTRGLTNSQMQSILDQVGSSKMNYPLENCGEFNAINNALNNGVDIGSLRVYSIERVGGIYKPPCINCQNLYGELLHFTQ